MFQQLLNTTAIWLLCLIAYDLFLGMETYYRYNRVYLLVSLLLGIILPAVNWQTTSAIHHTAWVVSVQEVVSVKQNIEQVVTPADPAFDVSSILYLVYFGGVLLYLGLIGKEAILLAGLYRAGRRSKEGKWTVIETDKDHGPFSIFNCIFVGSRQQYDAREWSILLRHEGEHITRLHFIDLILVQLVKVVFWFHPLIYLFRNRILMVHEFQADVTGADQPLEYGAFLVEQALLQSNPTITNSFNRSPIKKRIMMLTKKSSNAKLVKALIAIPVVVCCMLCFTKTAYSYRKGEGNVIVFKGNRFEFSGPAGKQTVEMVDGKGVKTNGSFTDKETGKTEPVTFTVFACPVKMNGEVIHSSGDVTKEPVFQGKEKSFSEYIFNSVRTELAKLEDGEYFIHVAYPVVDREGRLVYYENEGVTASGNRTIDGALKQMIDNKVVEALDNAPKFKPATLKGKAVNWYDVWAVQLGYRIMIKNHTATLQYKEPQQM